MQIKIAERLRPFSHQPGVLTVLPNSTLIVQVFPAKVLFFDQEKQVAELSLSIQGPLKEFTVQQDLERGELKVWGKAQNGFLRYRIVAAKKVLCALVLEKSPTGFEWKCSSSKILMDKPFESLQTQVRERLSLGSHKSQESEGVRRRLDLSEIFPHWLRLGLLVPEDKNPGQGGTLSLLETIKSKEKKHLIAAFQNLFLAGFEGILAPRLTDTDFQGFSLPESSGSSAFSLLTKGAEFIRFLFLQVKENTLDILPQLPSEFHSGRYLHIPVNGFGEMDLEWSKKKIRRLIFRSQATTILTLNFPKGMKTCRLRLSQKEKGEKIKIPIRIEFKTGKTYYFDRFEK